jgi:hypothetical protein
MIHILPVAVTKVDYTLARKVILRLHVWGPLLCSAVQIDFPIV